MLSHLNQLLLPSAMKMFELTQQEMSYKVGSVSHTRCGLAGLDWSRQCGIYQAAPPELIKSSSAIQKQSQITTHTRVCQTDLLISIVKRAPSLSILDLHYAKCDIMM